MFGAFGLGLRGMRRHVPRSQDLVLHFGEQITHVLGRLLHARSRGSVNLKATTEEHLGFTGRSEGIKAYAVVTARGR